MKKIIFLLLYLYFTCTSFAQADLDSLWTVWNDDSAPDTSRVQALNDFAKYGYLYSKPDSAFYYAKIMYDFARKKDLRKEMTSALSIQGGSFLIRSQFDSALNYYQRSLEISKEITDKEGMSKTLNNIGVVYSNLGNFPKALDYHFRSLTIKEDIGDQSGMAGSMNNIGIILMNQGDYPKALDYFQRSLKIKEAFSDKRGIAQTMNNIGLIYKRLGDTTRALEYFKPSLQICEEIPDKNASAGILSNIGMIYKDKGDYPKALEYYYKSLEVQEEISDRKGVASMYNNIGEIFMEQGNYTQALYYYQQSHDIYEEIADQRGLAGILINIGKMYNMQKHFDKALSWCNKGLRIAEEINILEEQKNACECLFDAYKATGNDNMALEFYENITKLKTDLQAGETAKMLQEMEFKKQMLADSLIREEEKLKLQIAHNAEVRKKTRTKNIFLISAAFLLIGIGGLFWRYIYVRKAKKAIEIEKDRSEGLLLNILPAEIAQELKDKGKAQARKFENVSILFTDFKEFTKIAEKLSAEELVAEINTCFESFDGICKKYGIEKIKTIGDSYMAAGGLPIPSEDAVKNTVLAGLEMMDCMIDSKKKKVGETKSTFEMRLGIHTGPVIAGIVGVSKFQYDVWGDTVNTASRIENAGKTGKVNISQSTFEALKNDPEFVFHARGKIKTKGKGEMEMWFVERALPDQAAL